MALRMAGGRVTGPDDPGLPAVIAAADLVLDGLLGIGGRGGLREPLLRPGPPWPRGPEQGTAGEPGRGPFGGGGRPAERDRRGHRRGGRDAVRADVTVTFGTWKPGLLIDPGAGHAGVVSWSISGSARTSPTPAAAGFQAADVAVLLRQPPGDSDKYRRGVLGVVAGSDRFTGAAALAVGGALRGGAGMVRLVSAGLSRRGGPPALAGSAGHSDTGTVPMLAMRWRRPGGCRPGWPGLAWAPMRRPGTGWPRFWPPNLPVLVDADGLTLIAAGTRTAGPCGPHAADPCTPASLARLLGADPAEVAARRLEHARAAAAEFGAAVLLKGSTTVIAPAGGGEVLVNPTGTSWLATAGTGDVLAGLAGALLAQGLAVTDGRRG